MRLQQKVAIVTGGASGMGQVIAERFAREGAAVVIADIQEQQAQAVAAGIRRAGGRSTAVHVDVVNEAEVQQLVDDTLSEFRRIDILVNCVGIAEFIPAAELSLAQWRRMLDVNLTGVFLCCQTVAKVMIAQRAGKIVNFASTAGLTGVPYMAHYTAAKHGVVGLTRALGVEWGIYNVNVNCICPGATATPMLIESTSAEYRAERAQRVPLQRLGQPDDQASVALFLSSPDSDYVTGAVICVDGGISAMSPATSTSALTGKA